jgi:hypothetical protein
MTIVDRRRLLGGLLALALAAAGLPTLVAPVTDAATPGLTVTLDCFSPREQTTITTSR